MLGAQSCIMVRGEGQGVNMPQWTCQRAGTTCVELMYCDMLPEMQSTHLHCTERAASRSRAW